MPPAPKKGDHVILQNVTQRPDLNGRAAAFLSDQPIYGKYDVLVDNNEQIRIGFLEFCGRSVEPVVGTGTGSEVIAIDRKDGNLFLIHTADGLSAVCSNDEVLRMPQGRARLLTLTVREAMAAKAKSKPSPAPPAPTTLGDAPNSTDAGAGKNVEEEGTKEHLPDFSRVTVPGNGRGVLSFRGVGVTKIHSCCYTWSSLYVCPE